MLTTDCAKVIMALGTAPYQKDLILRTNIWTCDRTLVLHMWSTEFDRQHCPSPKSFKRREKVQIDYKWKCRNYNRTLRNSRCREKSRYYKHKMLISLAEESRRNE